jgi:hypothetical protein
MYMYIYRKRERERVREREKERETERERHRQLHSFLPPAQNSSNKKKDSTNINGTRWFVFGGVHGRGVGCSDWGDLQFGLWPFSIDAVWIGRGGGLSNKW